tara:strand:+ start:1286 stop:1567 length:282 start_codon:yes stop_codon:yes gene_type:complete
MASKENSGALFKEEKKSEKHPDYKGTCLIGGEVYYIASWINESQEGKKYMSLKFTPKEEQAKYSKETTNATSKPEFSQPVSTPVTKTEDELPF